MSRYLNTLGDTVRLETVNISIVLNPALIQHPEPMEIGKEPQNLLDVLPALSRARMALRVTFVRWAECGTADAASQALAKLQVAWNHPRCSVVCEH